VNIGVIGSGNIGATVGALWIKAGHKVLFSSRHPERLGRLVSSLGANASSGTTREAAAFGDALLVAVPYAALPELGRELAAEMSGKVVLDAGNPYPHRDGKVASQVFESGTGSGIHSAGHLVGARLVRAFNTIFYKTLESEAHRSAERLAIPLAGDDGEAVRTAEALVSDAGFEAVVVGPLSRAKDFDPGTPVYGKALTARELRAALGLAAQA
jgi:predicted dinucleotide-binding enzyme